MRLPSICILCNQIYKSNLALCEECIKLLKKLGPKCPCCAHPLPDDIGLCGLCIQQKPHFDKVYIDYEYTEPLRGLLHQFKYTNALYLAGFFSQLMFNSVNKATIMPQCIIPVPMHPERLKSRGFNQAVVLSKLLAKRLRIPYNLNCCKKIKNTSAQASLSQKERLKNLKSAFSAASLEHQHVLIVDDLLTTGSTANEIAFLLKQNGVQRVDVCCPARAVKDGFNHSL